jgi:hypothetical protein
MGMDTHGNSILIALGHMVQCEMDSNKKAVHPTLLESKLEISSAYSNIRFAVAAALANKPNAKPQTYFCCESAW